MDSFQRVVQDDHTSIRMYLGAIRRLGIYNPELRVEAVTELMCFVFARDQVLMNMTIDGHRMDEDGAHVERHCYRGILPRLLAMDPNEHGWHDLFNVAHSKIESALMSEEMVVAAWQLDEAASEAASQEYLQRREAGLEEMRRAVARSMPKREESVQPPPFWQEARAGSRQPAAEMAL